MSFPDGIVRDVLPLPKPAPRLYLVPTPTPSLRANTHTFVLCYGHPELVRQ